MDAAAPGAEASSSSSDISVAASKSISPSGVNGMSKFVDLRAALFSLKVSFESGSWLFDYD